MNVEQLIHCLQNPANLATIHAEELDHLVLDYPWFGTAQLLSAMKQQKENKAEATSQIQKALLYVQHPLWLQIQLNRFDESHQTNIPVPDNNAEISKETVVERAEVTEISTELHSKTYELDAAADAEILVEAINEQEAHLLLDETETITNAELFIEAVNDIETAALIEDAHPPHEDKLLVKASDEQDKPLEFFKPLSDILKKELPADAKLSFEPLHTVDYFASQGIQLREDRLANDKLGKQLKTFTQWLKTMKKVNPEEEKLDTDAEQAVVQIAVGSNTSEEIVTESMAKVLEQQGKVQSAIELYRKLSLLHPEKSVYFATQIQRLNQ